MGRAASTRKRALRGGCAGGLRGMLTAASTAFKPLPFVIGWRLRASWAPTQNPWEKKQCLAWLFDLAHWRERGESLSPGAYGDGLGQLPGGWFQRRGLSGEINARRPRRIIH